MFYLFNSKYMNEYLGEVDFFAPDCTTPIPPPDHPAKTIPCFDPEGLSWNRIIPDYRNDKIYKKTSSRIWKIVSLVGEIPDDFTLVAPPDEEKDYRWDGENWIEYVKPITIQDYDSALESHLDSELFARGYTKRSPVEYSNSSNPRWKQDAEDWIEHLTAVMEYGLQVMNDYEAGHEIPTLDVFKENLPKINWSFKG